MPSRGAVFVKIVRKFEGWPVLFCRTMGKHARPKNLPLAYLITFCTYGHRLPGSAAGSVNRFLNEYDTPGLPVSPELEGECRRRMKQHGYEMDRARRDHVRAAIIDACRFRGWELVALHVRPTHVHSVVQSDCHPDFISEKMKGRSSRRAERGTTRLSGTAALGTSWKYQLLVETGIRL